MQHHNTLIFELKMYFQKQTSTLNAQIIFQKASEIKISQPISGIAGILLSLQMRPLNIKQMMNLPREKH